MPGADEEDECDSRTASFGQQRSQNRDTSSTHSQSDASGSKPERKRTRINDDTEGSSAKNIASTNAGEDSREGSSSSSSQESDSDNSEDEPRVEDISSLKAQPPSKGAVPAVRWNKGSKSAIRTTLGGKRSASGASTPSQGQTGTADEKGRDRSASTTVPDPGSHNPTPQGEIYNSSNITEGPDRNASAEGQPSHAMSISDGSESGEITEGDDDIMLNIDGRNEESFFDDNQPEAKVMPEKAQQSPDHHQRDQVNGHRTLTNGSDKSHLANSDSNKDMIPPRLSGPTKEDAIRSQNLKYRAQPTVLADLFLDDLEIQAKYIFYELDIRDLDLSLPIKCINCRKEGHLTQVCPDKECEHCGAWERHESCFCPSWRRCQRCRERGHDKEKCTSRLIGTAMEVPCDRCGSSDHLENDCDLMWKSPWPHRAVGPITVSVSCSKCTSRQHLIGDCPNIGHPLGSSSWTLKCYDPSMISEPSLPSGGNFAAVFRDGNKSGMRIRGRADARSPSPESDDMRSGPRYPIRKDQPRSHIRFAPGIGRSTDQDDRNNFSQNQDYGRNELRDDYRDRDEFVGYNTRQRSLSPDPRPANRRGRGDRNGDNRRPPLPREPPPSRGRGQHPRGRGRGAPRGRANKSKPPGAGGGDAYRPLPGAAKKAWDRHRL